MNDIVRELNNVIEKYKDKTFHTGELNFVEMAKSCKIVIQDLLQEKADRENPKHICDTCKHNYPGYDVTMREECEGCCSWNDKYEPKEATDDR